MSLSKAAVLTILIVVVIMVVVAAITAGLGAMLAPAGLKWLATGLNLGASIWMGFYGIPRIFNRLAG